jgi:hypothetical protein
MALPEGQFLFYLPPSRNNSFNKRFFTGTPISAPEHATVRLENSAERGQWGLVLDKRYNFLKIIILVLVACCAPADDGLALNDGTLISNVTTHEKHLKAGFCRKHVTREGIAA